MTRTFFSGQTCYKALDLFIAYFRDDFKYVVDKITKISIDL
ncbi:hypothetical protein PFLA_a0881 [Pseudoalteromonas flavipulchra NCIMB 2033 = ATCC BAA-314]|nr:hypothetical protein [Pseudoalteromonas flavipulchra NCIMB 2033 = ATCC BAA-314]